jgi:hypothetical protein
MSLSLIDPLDICCGCIDNYDYSNPSISGWIAAKKKITGIYIDSDKGMTKANLGYMRKDVAEALSSDFFEPIESGFDCIFTTKIFLHGNPDKRNGSFFQKNFQSELCILLFYNPLQWAISNGTDLQKALLEKHPYQSVT